MDLTREADVILQVAEPKAALTMGKHIKCQQQLYCLRIRSVIPA